MDYRFYCLDGSDRIVSAKDVVARDDLEALQEAENDCEEFAVEIWQGERRVARVKLGNAPLESQDRMSL